MTIAGSCTEARRRLGADPAARALADRDLHCSVAGLDETWVANLESFTGPVLAIGAGHGWGAYMEDQLGLFGSTDVVFRFHPNFGHADHFWSERHRSHVERPILHWLERVAR